ncbi:hypothetical protein ACFOSD_00440 [Salinispirillum marinum]|uniref:DUF4041 domain-containing protein n=2 Tax=Saccharospirillaceae TaxID=255527 RepID=A0ABV8BBK6_9GAMM
MNGIVPILLVLVAVGVVGVMAFMHFKYGSSQSKRERLLSIANDNKKLQNLLRTMPGNYLSKDLRDFMYRTIINNYKTLIKEDRRSRFLQSDLNEITAQRQAFLEGRLKPPAEPVIEVEHANAARAGLKSMFGHIKRAYEDRQLKGQEAQALVAEVEHRLVITAADFFRSRARHAHKKKRYREAMALWRKSIENISGSKFVGQYKQRILEGRAKIKEIEKEWKEQNKEAAEARSEVLAEKLDEWASAEDEWKKKQVYDD